MVGINEFDLDKAQADHVAYFCANTGLTAADVGKPAKLEAVTAAGVTKGLFNIAGDGEAIYGKITVINVLKNDWNSGSNASVANDGITVQNKGFATFEYDATGVALAIGESIVGDAAGKVQGAGAVGPHIVHEIDTNNETCVVELNAG